MATYTDAEMLESIRSAIKTLVDGGASVRTVDGRTWTGLKLDNLQELESLYQGRVNAATATNGVARPFTMFGLRAREPGGRS